MYYNYLKVAVRNLAKYKIYSAINILGLALGLTAALLLTIFVVDEFTFDRFNTKSDRIYRLVSAIEFPGQAVRQLDVTPPAMAPTLSRDYPEVEAYTQIASAGRADIAYQNNAYYENFVFADNSLFDLFDFEFVSGDRETSLLNPGSVVLTQETAGKYFGTADPMGKLLQSNRGEFLVTGVLADIPKNSHLQFTMLFATPSEMRGNLSDWDNFQTNSYVLLSNSESIELLRDKLPEFIQSRAPEELQEMLSLRLQILEEIHFGSADIENSVSPNMGSLSTIYTLAGIAFFILFIACINYINLATARSANRSGEIAMRKVVGAERRQLVFQFLSESVLLTLFAFVLALAATQLLLPIFNGFTGKELTFENIFQPMIAFPIIAIGLFVGIGAGTYPALFLASVNTLNGLKGKQQASRSSVLLRKSLVTTQFCLSVALLIATLTAIKQMDYISSKPLGFDRESVVVVDINSGNSRNGYQAIKNEFLAHPNVSSVSVSSRVPGEWKDLVELNMRVPGQDIALAQRSTFIGIDEDFLQTFGLELQTGRNFLGAESEANDVIVNQRLLELMDWDSAEAIGQAMVFSSEDIEDLRVTIVGVVADFHFRSLHEEIGPLILGNFQAPIQNIDYFSAKISTVEVAETLRHLQDAQARYDADTPFEYHFLDEQIDNFYRNDELTTTLFSIAAGIAMLIACLGLYGLSALSTEQRSKEIGIRKVLGATVRQILALLSLEYVKLVVLANVIAWPVVYYLLSRWLDTFAYHDGLSAISFALAAIFLLGATLLTVSGHAIRVALANPIDSMRYE